MSINTNPTGGGSNPPKVKVSDRSKAIIEMVRQRQQERAERAEKAKKAREEAKGKET